MAQPDEQHALAAGQLHEGGAVDAAARNCVRRPLQVNGNDAVVQHARPQGGQGPRQGGFGLHQVKLRQRVLANQSRDMEW